MPTLVIPDTLLHFHLEARGVRSASRAFCLRLQLALHLDQVQLQRPRQPAPGSLLSAPQTPNSTANTTAPDQPQRNGETAALSAFFCIGQAQTKSGRSYNL